MLLAPPNLHLKVNSSKDKIKYQAEKGANPYFLVAKI